MLLLLAADRGALGNSEGAAPRWSASPSVNKSCVCEPPCMTATAPDTPAAAAGPAQPAAGASTRVWEQVVPDLSNKTGTVLPDVAKAVVALERQGKGRKIISMSLYGADPRYTQGAIENAMLAQRDWAGWTLRVYYGQNVPPEVLQALRVFGAETLPAQGYRTDSSMMWRFFALEDRTATRVIFRDADARLIRRDLAAVEEWVATDWPVHTMHDHFWHDSSIMGGMWGAVNGFINPRVLDTWRQPSNASAATGAATAAWGQDQAWLREAIFPAVKNATLTHASWHCKTHGEAEWRPFPTLHQHSHDFVGQVYSVKSKYQGDFEVAPCPQQCRPPNATTC